MEMVYRDSKGLAIFRTEVRGKPYEVVRLVNRHRDVSVGVDTTLAYESGKCLGMYHTRWEAEIALLLVTPKHSTATAVTEVARRERSLELHQKYLADEEVRVWGLITTVKALAPGNDTKVCLEHLGGGITAVGIYPKGTDAYCWVTDGDGFILMGFYDSQDDEVGGMVERLGHQEYSMDTNEGVKAVADTLRTFWKFFGTHA